MSDNICLDELLNALRRYIEENEQIKSELKSVKIFVQSSKKDNDKVKVVGTTAGVIGTLAATSLFFAPLTGGLSLAAGIALTSGTAVSVGTSVICAFADSHDGKIAIKRIEKCQRDHNESVERLEKEIKKIINVVNKLVLEHNIDKNTAMISTIAVLASSSSKICSASSLVINILNALKSGEIQKLLAPVGISLTKRMNGAIAISGSSHAAFGAMNSAQKAAFKTLLDNPDKFLGPTISTTGKIFYIAQLAFTVADVCLLIKEWKKQHPLVAPIDTFIDGLTNSINAHKNQLDFLRELKINEKK